MTTATKTATKTASAAKGLPKLAKTEDSMKVREYIKKCIDLKFGTLTAYAEKENVSLQYISMVLGGHKAIPDWMLKRFKIAHVVAEHWELAA
jgi:hypothetical protein